MKLIPLTRGLFAKVDDDDFEHLNQWKWHAYTDGHTYYAVRHTPISEDPKRKNIQMHRVIMSTPKDMVVDHINHNGLDNQKHNMRNCSHAQNIYNMKSRKNETSTYKGVSLYANRTKKKTYYYWEANINFGKKTEFLGLFETEELAALAYNKRAGELFGKFAYLNILLENPRTGIKPVNEKSPAPKIGFILLDKSGNEILRGDMRFCADYVQRKTLGNYKCIPTEKIAIELYRISKKENYSYRNFKIRSFGKIMAYNDHVIASE